MRSYLAAFYLALVIFPCSNCEDKFVKKIEDLQIDLYRTEKDADLAFKKSVIHQAEAPENIPYLNEGNATLEEPDQVAKDSVYDTVTSTLTETPEAKEENTSENDDSKESDDETTNDDTEIEDDNIAEASTLNGDTKSTISIVDADTHNINIAGENIEASGSGSGSNSRDTFIEDDPVSPSTAKSGKENTNSSDGYSTSSSSKSNSPIKVQSVLGEVLKQQENTKELKNASSSSKVGSSTDEISQKTGQNKVDETNSDGNSTSESQVEESTKDSKSNEKADQSSAEDQNTTNTYAPTETAQNKVDETNSDGNTTSESQVEESTKDSKSNEKADQSSAEDQNTTNAYAPTNTVQNKVDETKSNSNPSATSTGEENTNEEKNNSQSNESSSEIQNTTSEDAPNKTVQADETKPDSKPIAISTDKENTKDKNDNAKGNESSSESQNDTSIEPVGAVEEQNNNTDVGSGVESGVDVPEVRAFYPSTDEDINIDAIGPNTNSKHESQLFLNTKKGVKASSDYDKETRGRSTASLLTGKRKGKETDSTESRKENVKAAPRKQDSQHSVKQAQKAPPKRKSVKKMSRRIFEKAQELNSIEKKKKKKKLQSIETSKFRKEAATRHHKARQRKIYESNYKKQ